MAIFNWTSEPIEEGDAWYIPERHDLFKYDDPMHGNTPSRSNPEFFTHKPTNGSPNYNFDYRMPSFSCIPTSSRATNQIPNGGCNPCNPPGNCLTGHPYDGEPYSGCASQCRYVAITPVHIIASAHYWAGQGTIGTKRKFYGTDGTSFQKIKFTELHELGNWWCMKDGSCDGDEPPGPPGWARGELAILEFKAAEQNIEDPEDGDYNTSLGDRDLAPDVEIKYPYFMPEVMGPYDPIIEYMEEQYVGIQFDQDLRGYVTGLRPSFHMTYGFYPKKTDFVVGFRSLDNSSGSNNLQYLIDRQLAIREDMAKWWHMQGESSSPLFTYKPNITGDSPIFLGLYESHNFTNMVQDYVLPVIEEYDKLNDTSYATDLSNRILTRQQLGIPEVGGCCVVTYPYCDTSGVCDSGYGACCHPSFDCVNTDFASCNDIGGGFKGRGTACAGGVCDSGACCYENDCVSVDNDSCDEIWGHFKGYGTECPLACDDPTQCWQTSPAGCQELNGIYLGDGEACHPWACDDPEVEGACCYLLSDSCGQETQYDCENQYGTYKGNFVECFADNRCPADFGACCDGEVTCLGEYTEYNCMNDQGGTHWVRRAECSTTICNQGACCAGFDYCLPGQFSKTDCEGFGGIYKGYGTTCADVLCAEDVGACCVGNNCIGVYTESECGSVGGTHKGVGTTCTTGICSSGCVSCSSQERSSMNRLKLHPNGVKPYYNNKRANNYEIEMLDPGEQQYTNVQLPNGDCILMDCRLNCPYPLCME